MQEEHGRHQCDGRRAAQAQHQHRGLLAQRLHARDAQRAHHHAHLVFELDDEEQQTAVFARGDFRVEAGRDGRLHARAAVNQPQRQRDQPLRPEQVEVHELHGARERDAVREQQQEALVEHVHAQHHQQRGHHHDGRRVQPVCCNFGAVRGGVRADDVVRHLIPEAPLDGHAQQHLHSQKEQA